MGRRWSAIRSASGAAGEAGAEIAGLAGADPVVASVLLLYGLHPLDFETRVRRAIEKARPALRSYGSDAELSSVNAGAVRDPRPRSG